MSAYKLSARYAKSLIELAVEKTLGIRKDDIGKTISIEDYNKACQTEVMKYQDKWEEVTRLMGYWVDMGKPYVTFDNEYIETLWWALKELFNKGYLYKSVSIQPYSPAAGTGLSSHELNQPGTYKDVKDTTVVAMFSLSRTEGLNPLQHKLFETAHNAWAPFVSDTSLSFGEGRGEASVYFMAWTTTPWTLPSNCGLTVGPNIDYVLVQTFNPYSHQPCNVILAKNHAYLKLTRLYLF